MTRPLTRRLTSSLAVAGLLTGGLLSTVPAEAATVTGTVTRKAAVRAGAGTSAKVLGTLERGQRIPTTAKAANGWVRVRFHKVTAYVAASKLTLASTNLPPAPSTIDTTTAKVATAGLNVRSGPSATKTVVGRVAEGDGLRPTGKLSGEYAQVSYGSSYRWVSVRYLGSLAPTPKPVAAGTRALAFARSQLGKPYSYGAVGPQAYDCSGLTGAAWKAAGVTLPRTSEQQFAVGQKVAQADLKPGDLVFFYGSKPTHVGLYVGAGQIIHAPRPGKTVEYSMLAYMPFSGARRPG
ncbi:MAG: NlpC/P60 family protein [Friedmanniella sp.]|jgi:cell wall-associated NlpC family hydrolase